MIVVEFCMVYVRLYRRDSVLVRGDPSRSENAEEQVSLRAGAPRIRTALNGVFACLRYSEQRHLCNRTGSKLPTTRVQPVT